MENKLRVTCRGAGEIALHLLEPLQGELKTLSVENYEKMVKSFHEHGFSDPIRMWECPDDGKLYILDGHQRVRVLLQLKEQGWEIPQIPVDYVEASSLDEAKKKLLQIFVSQYGRVDIQGLYEFVSQTAITSDDLMQMDIPHVNIPEFIEGFMPETVTVDVREHERTINTNAGSVELEYKEGEDDVPDEESVPTIAQPGQVWQLGDHRLMCGDSTKIDQVQHLMNGQMADMVFTDPPYGVAYEGGHNEKKREGIVNDTLEGQDLTDLFLVALQHALAVTHDHAAFYIWYASGKSVETYASFAKLDLKVRAVIAWYKIKSGLGAFMAQYIPNYEPCIYAHKTKCAPQWHGPTDEKTVWELKRDGRNEFHPTQKPVELPERAVKNSSKFGDVVLDLFGGSGATMIACEKQGRKCYTMEVDPKYCDVMIQRWQTFTGKEAVLI